MRIEDKYNLTKKQSEYLAKKFIADTIYCGIKMEGSKMTFPETKTILDGVNVPNATLDDIQAILNMRDAWKYVLGTLNEPFTIDYACKVNSFVARNESLEWGVLRTGRVGISGTDYVPPIPERDIVERDLKELLDASMSATEKALTYFVWGAKSQLFWDGNKRTSLICANKLLLQEGKGLLSIKDADIAEFNKLLTNYYEELDGNKCKHQLIEFLYSSSMRGIEFENDLTPERKQSFRQKEILEDMREIERLDGR